MEDAAPMPPKPLHEWLVGLLIWDLAYRWWVDEVYVMPRDAAIVLAAYVGIQILRGIGIFLAAIGRSLSAWAHRRRQLKDERRKRRHELNLAKLSRVKQLTPAQHLKQRLECIRLIHEERVKAIQEAEMEPDEEQAALDDERQRYKQEISSCG